MYKATIFYDVYRDDFEEGEDPEQVSGWMETLDSPTPETLKEAICNATYSKWDYIEQDDVNGYEKATEYFTGYHRIDAFDSYNGKLSDDQMEAWKQGKLEVFAVHCHILVSKITEEKAVL